MNRIYREKQDAVILIKVIEIFSYLKHREFLRQLADVFIFLGVLQTIHANTANNTRK